jgi:hypothetical protein
VVCDASDSLAQRAEFETAFERSGRFSFSVEVTASLQGTNEYKRAYRILADGPALLVGEPEWLRFPRPSLELAIASLTGVSIGSAHMIPRLLMPDSSGDDRSSTPALSGRWAKR